jgi:cell division protein ZapA (FtsZ GTPase activity inhibitor)
MTSKTVSITLLKKTYQIKCHEEAVPALEKVSRYLDNTMRQIKNQGSHDFSDIAVLAALNIGNELYQQTQKVVPTEDTKPDMDASVRHVQARLRKTLGLKVPAEPQT